MTHWAVKYIGLPYEIGARGPATFDCWGLVRWIYEREFRLALPEIPGISEEPGLSLVHTMLREMTTDWVPALEPFDGCGVAMSQGKAYHHVGVFAAVDGGKVIHCWEKANTSADSLMNLRIKGFRSVHFYRHRLWPTS